MKSERVMDVDSGNKEGGDVMCKKNWFRRRVIWMMKREARCRVRVICNEEDADGQLRNRKDNN